MDFETNRLIIRPFMPGDFDDYFNYIMDPELQYMLGLHGVSDRASALETFQWLLDHRAFLALIEKGTGRAIGHVCIHPPLERLQEELSFKGKAGYSLSFAIAKWVRRKGYMEEALCAVMEALFVRRSVDYMDCESTSWNIASQALQEKLGFSDWDREQQVDGVELITKVLQRETWMMKTDRQCPV